MSGSDTAIRYALLWDVPRLRHLNDAGADAFIAAFSAAPLQDPPERPVGSLGLAAAGVVADRASQGDSAQSFYADISGGFWEDLFRKSLEGWSPSVEGSSSIVEAADLVGKLPTRGDLRAHLLLKLATFAYDKQDASLFESLLRDSLAATRPGTRLQGVVQMEVMNFLGEYQPFPERFGELPASRLVDRPWIDDWALEGAQGYIGELLTDKARGPWSTVFRGGRRPLDRAVAAEIQVAWAGALWQRRPVRRQLGAQILFSDPPDAQQAAYGLFSWFDGGGRDLVNVSDLVEPKLDQAAVDWLIHALASRIGPRPAIAHRLTEGCTAFWDCLSDDLIPLLLERLVPEPGDHPLATGIRRLWALFSVRVPAVWGDHFLALDEATQLAMGDALGPTALRTLTGEAAARLLALLETPPEEEPLSDRGWLVRATLEDRFASPGQAPPLNLADAPPHVIIEVSSQFPERVDRSLVRTAVSILIEQLNAARRDAREGKFGMGSASTALLVARGSLILGGDAQAVGSLRDMALDDELASHLRLEALLALGELAAEGVVQPSMYWALRDTSLSVSGLELLGVDQDTLEAARLLALSRSLEPADEVRLLALSRSRDGRAREIAVSAAGIASQNGASERLDEVLLTALFDPEEAVIRRSAEVLGHRQGHRGAFQVVLESRLGELIDTRRRRVRAEVATAARELRARS